MTVCRNPILQERIPRNRKSLDSSAKVVSGCIKCQALMSLFDFLKHSIVQFDMQYMGKLATNPKIQSARRES